MDFRIAISWQDQILAAHKEQTGFFKELIDMKTLAELDQIICDTVNIDIEDYKKMTLSEQHEVREMAREGRVLAYKNYVVSEECKSVWFNEETK